ncbi:hypothetical protein Tco_0968205 [Tanacetum coccineum]
MASNNRSSRRQKKIPSKFVDHVMENQSQKKNDKRAQNETKEIGVEKVGLNNGEDENGVGDESGVFANRDKDHYNGRKSDATDIGTDSLSNLEPEVEILNDNNEAPKKLNYKPTVINENGVEVVIFDEMIVKKGSERWNLTISGYFVGYWMAPNELRMTEVPLEAWSTDGISALSSSLGIPLIMDAMTASMCHSGMGRTDFARVLIEMDASKEFKSVIEVQYKDSGNKIKGTKKVKVSYDWKPAACSHCKVFGHDYAGCSKRIKTPKEVELEKVKKDEQMKKKSVINENRAYKRDKNFGYYQNYVRDKGKSTNEKADSIRNNRNGWTGVVNKRQEYRKKQGETSE